MSSEFWIETPTLKGAHVLLRPTTLDDVEGLAAAHDEPDTLMFFPYGIDSEPPSQRTVEHALASVRQTLTQSDATSGEIVGTTSLYNMSELHGRVTVGYTWISSRARGSAINVESKLLLLEHIFGTLEARRAELNVDDLNVRSRAAVLGIGAREEGALRQHARRRDGTWRTTMVYGVTADDWPQVRAGLERRVAQRSGN
ncbi:GNAT family N-acetyltransferase [Aldersonia kunmingensis]|uniref:GNAT family N-acetyltransferase n=1 Tax=Aldersonia kunmingensis TaxID=408066 RepID=UPI000835BC42|nr:GNAT family protein [Aldersonia kunmingensis]